jgi:four helix bundle protein
VTTFKFEDLEVWKISLDLSDCVYDICAHLPDKELFNLNSQIRRSCTSISLNIAEGSTCSSNSEQARYLKIAIRSLIECVACERIILKRGYLEQDGVLINAFTEITNKLFAKLNSFLNYLNKG